MPVSRRTALHGLGASAALLATQGFAIGYDGKAQFSIGAVKPDAQASHDAIGLSFEKTELTHPWFAPQQALFIALLRNLGSGVIRLGGNGVDLSSWRGAHADLKPIPPDAIAPLAAFLKQSGWSVIYGLNMAQTTPELMAEEAQFVAPLLGSALIALQIGNEPNYYRGHFRPQGWGFADYFAEWTSGAGAVRAVLPHTALLGPSSVGHYDYAVAFASRAPGNVWLAQHYYRGDGQDPNSTAELLLTADPALTDMLQALGPLARKFHLNGFIIDEANSFFRGGAKGVSDRYVAALWTAWFLAETTSRGVRGVNFHGGSAVYSPLYFNHNQTVEIRPAYYGLKLFSEFCGGRFRQVQIEGPEKTNVKCYAVARSDGGSNILMFNLDFLNGVTVTLTGLAPGRYRLLRLEGTDALSETGVTLGGAALAADGGLAGQYEDVPVAEPQAPVKLKPLSAALLLEV